MYFTAGVPILPEPLKNLYNKKMINKLALTLQEAYEELDTENYIEDVFDDEWSNVILKRHSFKKITTRKYYVGIRRITAIINGHELADKSFQLVESD
jgi:hypothetical protein